MTARPILVCEPQCHGFEHARHNAALVATVKHAFPGVPIVLAAEGEHLAAVQAAGTTPLTTVPMPIPASGLPPLRRIQAEWRVHGRALAIAREVDAALLLFASLSAPGILALHGVLRLTGNRPSVLGVVHGALAELDHPQRSLAHRLLGLRQSLRWPLPPRVRLIALGEPILRALEELAPNAARHFSAMPLPYCWEQDAPSTASPSTPPCFAFLGVANRFKGFDRFVRVAHAVRTSGVPARFVLAGFVPEGLTMPEGVEVVQGVGRVPLSASALAERVRSADFVIWTGEPSHYRLTASGSFQDALSFLKPGIYLTNPYIAHYAAQMGDIGYLCASESALIDTVIAVAQQPDAARYAAQGEAIAHGRRVFEPALLGERLRAVATEVGVSLPGA